MEKNVQESTEENNSGSHQSYTVGAIVATQAHPYLRGEVHPKIGSYNHLTPPFMVITEAHHSGKHDTETSERRSSSFKCLYYSTETGKFEDNWFKKEELKFVEMASESLGKSSQSRTFSQLKRRTGRENGGLIGLQVILTTVDLELEKTMVYKDPKPGTGIYKERAILDFLPPLGTIISISKVLANTQYSEKDGKPVMKKGRILAKIRWYNNKTAKFSEQEITLAALKEVKPLEEINFDKDAVYPCNKEMDLEDSDVKLTAVPVKFHDIVFNHYKYEFRFKNLFTNEILTINDGLFELMSETINNVPCKTLRQTPKGGTDFKANNWYKIKYVDRFFRYTERIIQVLEVKEGKNSGKDNIRSYLEANCLLRNGRIRNFYVDRIIRFETLPEEFITKFIEKKSN